MLPLFEASVRDRTVFRGFFGPSGWQVCPALVLNPLCQTVFNMGLKSMINVRKTKSKQLVNLSFC